MSLIHIDEIKMKDFFSVQILYTAFTGDLFYADTACQSELSDLAVMAYASHAAH